MAMMVTRRGLLSLGVPRRGSATEAGLATAPLTLGSGWDALSQRVAPVVLARLREVALAGIRLLSDRQPREIRVDAQSSGPPAIWLHTDHPDTAVIYVDIPPHDWPRLAYQFGHEFGHVLCNSWQWGSAPAPPCQWLEESLVEGFSLHNLGVLAESCARRPLFPGDDLFPVLLRRYQPFLIDRYKQIGGVPDGRPISGWFRANRARLETAKGAAEFEGPAMVAIATLLGRDRRLIEDYGALNRWPERSAVPLEDYLRLWAKSCTELGAPGRLPARIKAMLGVG